MTTLQEQSTLCLDELKPQFPPLSKAGSRATIVGIECGLKGMTQWKQFQTEGAPSGLILGWGDISLMAVGPDASSPSSLRLYIHGCQCSRNHDGTIAGPNDKSTENYRITGLKGPFPLASLHFEGNHGNVTHWAGSFDMNDLGNFVDRLREYEASEESEKPKLYTVQFEALDREAEGTYTEYASFIALSDTTSRDQVIYS